MSRLMSRVGRYIPGTTQHLPHHDQKEPTTTERVYRHLFAAVRAAHSGHAFAVLEHCDKAMTLEATELALAISIYDLRAVAMDVFGMRVDEIPFGLGSPEEHHKC